ncbi:MAG: prephenate dehydratase [Deltaproteobacteria bacterium]|jgi:prephenate dehydratase|nr:prephenate dehydratase [Deltaproteobacteria bacterium]MBW2480734.1 prephenate dehydratase [Deltaproteobacteria bacterium]
MKQNEISSKINKIDRELLVLLQERMGLALRSKKFQETYDDVQSEENVLERVNRMNLDLVKSSFSRQLLKTIIDESKRLQDEDRQLVAFQGEHGAYGEVASRKLVPNGAYIPCLEFIDVFRGVEDGHFDLGVVPVENSLEGAVTQVNDLLTTTALKVIGEVKVVVNHCLLATEATDYREIRVVYSHPQALAQCRDFLMRNKLEPRPYYDTAGAAKMLARENPKAAAAIASALCGELYDLEIIKEGIEDGPSNSTRFLLLSRDASTAKRDKTSIIFAVAHEAGQLYGVLQLFAEANINLTRISSMPLRSDPSNYSFFLDFEGSEEDASVADVLQKMSQMTIALKNLGSYPAYKGEA